MNTKQIIQSKIEELKFKLEEACDSLPYTNGFHFFSLKDEIKELSIQIEVLESLLPLMPDETPYDELKSAVINLWGRLGVAVPRVDMSIPIHADLYNALHKCLKIILEDPTKPQKEEGE